MFKYTYYRGRVALYSALKALNIGEGDEVITQAFTCLAVPEAIIGTGAKPVYVDIEPKGVNMDPVKLEPKISDATRAVIVQHTFGIPARMNHLIRIALKYDIPVIEDCCHTFSSSLNGRKTGEFGVASFYSFEWGKPLVVGIGGALEVNEDRLEEKVKQHHKTLHSPGFLNDAKIEVQYWGFKLLLRPRFYWPIKKIFHRLSSMGIFRGNYNPVSGGLAEDFSFKMSGHLKRRLNRKLKTAENFVDQSERVTNYYFKHITSSNVCFPKKPEDAETVFSRFPLFTDHKEEVLEKASAKNIEIADWYRTPVHPLDYNDLHKVYYKKGSCPSAELATEKIISLPVGKKVSDKNMNRIVNFLNDL